MEINEKLVRIFKDVFNNEELTLTDSTNSDDIEDWDSLANIELLTAMEKEFGIQFNIKDIQYLENVGGMIALIKKIINEKNQ